MSIYTRTGMVRSEKYHEGNRKRQHDRAEERARNGLCVRCGDPAHGWAKCRKCYEPKSATMPRGRKRNPRGPQKPHRRRGDHG